jgi:2-polyprenyl-6-methoxyphenol hydroxylase-like FAD-dependent oxidoreductase
MLQGMRRVVIVGAGIGGLCAARAVALAGHEPIVLERSPVGTAIGAGLVLWPNAVHALDALGRGLAVRDVGVPARRTVLRDAAGRTLSEVDVEALESHAGAPMLVLERPALHVVLADGVTVRYGAGVSTVDVRGVTLEDGERVDGDVVIGADGIGSVVREHVCPGAEPVDGGYTVIRGIAHHDIGRGEAFEAWGRGELVGGAVLAAGRSYWFYEAPSALIDGRNPLAAVGAERWPAPMPACSPPPHPRACSSTAFCALERCPSGRAGRWRCSATQPTRWSPTSARARLRQSRTPRRCWSPCSRAASCPARWPTTRRRGAQGRTCFSGSPRASPA